MKRLVTWLVALVLVAGSVGGYLWYRKGHQQVEPKFKTVKAERGKISAKVTATGTLSARVTVQVGSQVSGRLNEINVDFNSTVKKGQIIARLDPRLFEAALAKTKATYAQASGQLAKAQVNAKQAQRALDRAKKLKEDGLLGQADLDLAQTSLESANADVTVQYGNVASAAASLKEAEVNLGFTTIVSPIDGMVISRNVDVGQTVAASLQAPVLFTIAQDLKSIQLDTFVAEADVGKLQPDMPATFTVDAYPGKKFNGTVRVIRNAAQTVSNVVTYDAVLDVENPDLKLKPGMTANVTFIYAEKEGVLAIPNAALRFRPPPELMASASPSASGSGSGRRRSGEGGPRPEGAGGGGSWKKPGAGEDSAVRTVWILKDDKASPVRVVTGISDGTNTEIVSGGLHEGDLLITETTTPSDGKPAPTGAPGGGGAGGMRMRL